MEQCNSRAAQIGYRAVVIAECVRGRLRGHGAIRQQQQNLPHSMRGIRAVAVNPPVVVNKSKKRGDCLGSPGHLPSSPLPSPPPLHPEPTAESERRKKERDREHTLGITELAFLHPLVVRSNVGCPGAVAVGEIHRHRGGSRAASRRPAATDEHQLGAAGVDSPAAGGDRAESPPRATS